MSNGAELLCKVQASNHLHAIPLKFARPLDTWG